MDAAGLVEQMVQAGQFNRIVNNPLSQFGPPPQRYLGAELLPELEVPENQYTEEGLQFRTIVANDGTRYSPVQIKGGIIFGSVNVMLGETDIGSHFTGRDYDAFIRLLEQSGTGWQVGGGVNRPGMQAIASMLNWGDTTLNLPLIVKNEVQRWQAIVNSQVIRTGANGYREVVNFLNPTGQRVNAAGAWSSNVYDPYNDLMAAMDYMIGLGYTISRIITSQQVLSKLANNALIRQRVGRLSLTGGTITGLSGRASQARINEMLSEDGLPGIERYDRQYRTSTGSGYFLARDVLVMVATTGRDVEIDLGDLGPIPLFNTLGYYGVGRAAGQSDPGRVTHIQGFNNKPPRIEGEAWQTGFPVILSPQAIYVIKGIT